MAAAHARQPMAMPSKPHLAAQAEVPCPHLIWGPVQHFASPYSLARLQVLDKIILSTFGDILQGTAQMNEEWQ